MKNLSQHITESFINESKKNVTNQYDSKELELFKLVDNSAHFGPKIPQLYVSNKAKGIIVYMHDMMQDWKVSEKLEKSSKVQNLAKSLGYTIKVSKVNNFGNGIYGDSYDPHNEKVYQE